MVQRTRSRGCPPKPFRRSAGIPLASSKQTTLDGKASCREISDALWWHNATRVLARSPTGRPSLSLTATGSSNPGVRPEDLRAGTFDVTLPPRTSPGPLNAKTRKKTNLPPMPPRRAGATYACTPMLRQIKSAATHAPQTIQQPRVCKILEGGATAPRTRGGVHFL